MAIGTGCGIEVWGKDQQSPISQFGTVELSKPDEYIPKLKKTTVLTKRKKKNLAADFETAVERGQVHLMLNF